MFFFLLSHSLSWRRLKRRLTLKTGFSLINYYFRAKFQDRTIPTFDDRRLGDLGGGDEDLLLAALLALGVEQDLLGLGVLLLVLPVLLLLAALGAVEEAAAEHDQRDDGDDDVEADPAAAGLAHDGRDGRVLR